jgi:hypothetical protein
MPSNRELVARISALNKELRQNERDCIQVIAERDHNAEMADKLAEAIGNYFSQDVGEHSNINCPWISAPLCPCRALRHLLSEHVSPGTECTPSQSRHSSEVNHD